MYKSSILIAALVMGAYASENPFALEKNIQKIEQEESALLQALAKEQKRPEREEDALFEERISEPKISDVKPKESKAPSETEIVQEPEYQDVKKDAEESRPEDPAPSLAKQDEPAVTSSNETLEKVQKKEGEESKSESVSREAAPAEAKTIKPAPISVEKVSKKPEEPLTIRGVAGRSESEMTSKPAITKGKPSVEKEIEKVDAEIKELEERLEASKVKPATTAEASIKLNEEVNISTESNTTFDQELQEAIKSVQ